MAVFRLMIENLSVSQKDLCKNTFAIPIIQCYIFIKNVWLNCVNPVVRHTFFISSAGSCGSSRRKGGGSDTTAMHTVR